jgi:hypothetical protein
LLILTGCASEQQSAEQQQVYAAAQQQVYADGDNHFKTGGGLAILPDSEREAADNFLDELARYGLFVVRKGEVEAWLSHLGVPQKANGWRAKIFAAMGNDPSQATYVHRAKGDVWDFIGLIGKWLNDPNRRGIPE